MYPSKLREQSKIVGKQGYFENLNIVIIAGFDPSIDKDFSEGGILMLSNSEKSLINESMKSAEGRTINMYVIHRLVHFMHSSV